MTMTLSGSGTIAGLVAGGLPDATVTAPDLASGAARTNFGAGAVLQVVNGYTSTAVVSTATQQYFDTGITATITPTSATSKILVIVNLCGLWKSNNNLWNRAAIRLLRNGSMIGIEAYSQIATLTALEFRSGGLMYSKLDSPASTSALTYKLQFQAENLSDNAGIAVQKDNNSGESQIFLMEIAA